MSGPEIVSILDWRPDGRLKPTTGFVHEWYVARHAEVSEEQFRDALERAAPETIRGLLLDYVASQPERGSDTMVHLSLARFAEASSDSGFAAVQSLVDEVTSEQPPSRPTYEAYQIFQLDPLSRQRIVHALSTPEFRDFHRDLRSLGLSPSENLVTTARLYLNPSRLEVFRSESHREAWGILLARLPASAIEHTGSFNLIDTFFPERNSTVEQVMGDPRKRAAFEANVALTAETLEQLQRQYGVESRGPWDLRSLAELRPEERNSLLSRETLRVYHYLRDNYPDRVRDVDRVSDLVGLSSLHEELLQPVVSSGVSPGEVDRFLEIFGHDLGSMDLSYMRTPVIEYLNDPDFEPWVRSMVDRYPDVARLVDEGRISDIQLALLPSYPHRHALDQLNGRLAALGARAPILAGEDAPEMLAVLNDLERAGLPVIVDDYERGQGLNRDVFGWASDTARLREFRTRIADGRAEQIHEALRSHWRIDPVPLEALSNAVMGQQPAFWLDEENARRFNEIRDAYPLASYVGTASEKQEEFVPIRPDDVISTSPRLVEHHERLMNPQTRRLMQMQIDVETRIAGQDAIWTLDLERAVEGPLDHPLMDELVDALGTYGLTDSGTVSRIVFDRDLDVEKTLGELRDPGFRDRFERLAALIERSGAEARPDTVIGLSRVIERAPEESLVALDALRQLGYPMRWKVVQVVAEQFVDQPAVMQSLADPDFGDFQQSIRDRFYAGTLDLFAVQELAELYQSMSRTPELRNALRSPEFGQTLSYVRGRFGVTDLDPATLLPLAKLSLDFDPRVFETMATTLKERGERVVANDLILLSRIHDDSELRGLFSDRARLEAEVQDILQRRTPRERGRPDRITTLENQIAAYRQHGIDTAELERQLADYRAQYTERTPVGELSTLHLIRALMVGRAMEQTEVQEQLGAIVSSDIADKSTERGGLLHWRGGRLSFDETESYSNHDGAYDSLDYQFLNGGLASFHLHALEVDNSAYSGPSGFLGSGGDMGYAQAYGGTDVVVTALGHPEGPDGRPNESRILINLDVYRANRAESGTYAAHIVDLGVIEVPFRAQ